MKTIKPPVTVAIDENEPRFVVEVIEVVVVEEKA